MFVKWIIGVYTDVMSNTEKCLMILGGRGGRKMGVPEKTFQRAGGYVIQGKMGFAR